MGYRVSETLTESALPLQTRWDMPEQTAIWRAQRAGMGWLTHATWAMFDCGAKNTLRCIWDAAVFSDDIRQGIVPTK